MFSDDLPYAFFALLLSALSVLAAPQWIAARSAVTPLWRYCLRWLLLLVHATTIVTDLTIACQIVPDPIQAATLLLFPTTPVSRLPWLILYQHCLLCWLVRKTHAAAHNHRRELRQVMQSISQMGVLGDMADAEQMLPTGRVKGAARKRKRG